MTMAGTLVNTGVTPPISIPFRCCAMGATIPKEIIATVSGVSLCPVFTPSTPCHLPGLPKCGITISGNVNGTFVVPLNSYWRSSGCGSHVAEIAKLRFSVDGNTSEGSVYLSFRYMFFDVYIYCEFYEYEWWFNPPSPGGFPRYQLVHIFGGDGVVCDFPITVPNRSTQGVPGQPCDWTYTGTIGHSGSLTATPVHDDNWTPPPDKWI